MSIVDRRQGSASHRSLLSRLRDDKSGSSIIEFAFVIGPFAALLLATLQTSLIFFANQLLDTAAQASARVIMTGTAQKNSLSRDQFKAIACGKLPTFMQCSNLTVDVTTVASFASADMTAPTITYSGSTAIMPNRYVTGTQGAIVMVRLTYPWNVVGAPGLNMASMTNGQFLLMATTIAKTEPYT